MTLTSLDYRIHLMSKETAVVALGVWAIVLPYLGVPRVWLTILMVITGIGLIVIGFLLRAEVLSRGRHHATRHATFVESIPEETAHHEGNHEHKERINSLN